MLKYKKVSFSPRTPEGFRLATLGQLRSEYSNLRKQDILNGSEVLRLLDVIYYKGNEIPIDDHFWQRMERQIVRQSSTRISINSHDDVKKMMEMVVIEVSSKRISTNSSLLRKTLYSGISLDDERRKIALRLSCLFEDIEVIYWLLSQSEIEFEWEESVKKSIENEVKTSCPDFLIIVKMLFGSVERGEAEVTSSLDYALKVKVVPENAIAIAEIVLDKCRKAGSLKVHAIVDSQVQRVAKMTMDTNQAEANRIGILTKLLTKCPDLLKHKDEVIRRDSGKLLREAVSRGYNDLQDALLGLQDIEYVLEDDVEKARENLLHYAARGESGNKIVDFFGKKCENLIRGRNEKRQTPVHVAAMLDNRNLLKSVKSLLPFALEEALEEPDHAGRIPLHLAASKGDEETVQLLLQCVPDKDLLKRDIRGRTALHHAVTNRNGQDTAKKIVEALLNHLQCNKKKALLLSISAPDIGTADQAKDIDQDLRKFLKKHKETLKEANVLHEAATLRDSRLTWELLTQGFNISSIKERDAFRFVTKSIEKFSEQATDQPTLVDTLGRNVLAECISAHFLNPYIKSPITVSISGGSGSGKSSLMHQIEAYLLVTAAQLAFPDLWDDGSFNGAKKITPGSKGDQMCHKIEKGVYKLLEKGKYRDFKEEVSHLPPQEKPTMSLMYLLRDYLPKYKDVYKSLAYMDFNQLMKEGENDSVYESQGQSLGAVPRILTVNFNAGNYRGSTEAWAGLAVEITKEIENSMTWAQLLSTRWRNTWNRHSEDLYLQFILPCVLLAFVGPWIGWAAWKLIDRAPPEFKSLQYGSVPVTVIAIVWPLLRQVVSVFKPISTQISGYFTMPDHSQHLGYQQKVISDIKFLKEEIGKKPCFIFSFIAGEMCKNWWGLWKENVQGTCIPQYGSAPEGKLRVIAFVDDLDQCEETGIIPMLWAINLVFKVCEISVILTMDKATIQTACQKSSLVQDTDFADKFISKIVQLPVNISDPTDDEWAKFLDSELLREKPVPVEDPPSNVQSDRDRENRGEPNETGRSKDIESGRSPTKCEGWREGITIRFWSFIQGILYFLSFVVCNIRDETQRPQPDSQRWPESQPASMKMVLIQRAEKVRDTLMLSYNEEEANTFHDLKSYATGIQKLPREWKCYMNYHKFARNVVSKMKKVQKMHGWQVEFVVWTFVCSQWKHEMNVLIEDWYNYADEKDSNGEPMLKSSLKKIVADYIIERWETEKLVFSFSNCNQSSVGSEDKERKRWESLLKCLENVHDVSMEGIHCFQDFRYHCDARNLISKLYKPKKILDR